MTTRRLLSPDSLNQSIPIQHRPFSDKEQGHAQDENQDKDKVSSPQSQDLGSNLSQMSSI
jgi:hypothetical protein